MVRIFKSAFFSLLVLFQVNANIKEKIKNFSKKSEPKVVVEEILSQVDIQINGKKEGDIQVYNDELYSQVLKDGSLGLGESYMEGFWDSNNLDVFIYKILRANLDTTLKPTWAMRWSVIKAKFFNNQTKKKSLKVINEHYQLGNDLFENMLDSYMTYSCGYWKNARNLEEAQIAKYDLIAQKLGLKKGMRVLDIGCGWGGFSKYISEKYDVEVVGITLSENQAMYARKMCENLNVEIRVQDYRDIFEKFDRVVEIGMFEHVGPKNYREFMQKVYDCLKDDGLLMLHTIGSNVTSNVGDPWVDKYIFANGKLPSIAQIGNSIENLFIMEDWHNFSTDYDKTLMAWYAKFTKNWYKIEKSYPENFYKMWKYYLLSCAGSFRARSIQLWQVVLSKKGVLGGYKSIR